MLEKVGWQEGAVQGRVMDVLGLGDWSERILTAIAHTEILFNNLPPGPTCPLKLPSDFPQLNSLPRSEEPTRGQSAYGEVSKKYFYLPLSGCLVIAPPPTWYTVCAPSAAQQAESWCGEGLGC